MNRMAEIFGIMISHGFGHLLGRSQRKKAAKNPKSVSSDKNPNRWVRIRMILEDLGPTFVKLGQIFANRPDIVPLELTKELGKLRDQVPGFSFEEVKRVVLEDLGRPVDEVFLHLDETPVASASIAQVHSGMLSNGQKVAVKVQRPGLAKIFDQDIRILLQLGSLFENLILRSDVMDTSAILEEFRKSLDREMDFRNEALFLGKFSANFRDDPKIHVPMVYRDDSSKRILVMEYIEGVKPVDHGKLRAIGMPPDKVAKIGADSLLKQIFVHGFFHGDPHPGNILVMRDGRLCYLDFGMMGVIFGTHREHLAGILMATATGDSHALTEHLVGLAGKEDDPIPASLEEDVFLLLETYSHLSLQEIQIGEFISSLVTLILKYQLSMPPSLYLLVKAILTTEGLARDLDPDFQMIEHITPFVRRYLAERFNFKKAGSAAFDTSMAYAHLLREMPSNIKEAVKFFKKGKINFELEKESMETLLTKTDKISNRLSFSLIITGMIVGSSLVIQSGIPPLIYGIPFIGILGFLGAGIMGFALLIFIWRSGKF